MDAELVSDLLFEVCYGLFLSFDDIEKAGYICSQAHDIPLWIRVIAGGNPENLGEVLKTAREELGHELLGTDNLVEG